MPRPSDLPEWASTATFPAGIGTGSGGPTTDDVQMAVLAPQGVVPNRRTRAGAFNSWLRRTWQWINYLATEDAGIARDIYGDGSDGTVVIGAGTTTLARDMYYDSLTIQAGGELAANGYRIFVRGTLTTDVGGVLSCDGNNGGNGTTGSVAGGAIRSQGTLAATNVGGAGGDENPATAGGNGGNSSPGLGGLGGAGAAGFGGALAGSPGTMVPPTANNGGTPRSVFQAVLGRDLQSSHLEGGSGGGGGGGGSSAGDGGGSGGAGGGTMVLVARRIINNGTIRARGGNGGNGGIAAQFGGGGGGGGGGLIIVITRLGISGSGSLSVAGGTGGTGGTGGVAGATGTILQFAA